MARFSENDIHFSVLIPHTPLVRPIRGVLAESLPRLLVTVLDQFKIYISAARGERNGFSPALFGKNYLLKLSKAMY